jgi:sugar-specific transcriptional regulator TrmB
MQLDKTLQKYGLEAKESQLYLALLELGKSTILELSRKTNLKRAGLYYAIQNLIDKGLVIEGKDKKQRRHWTAVDPDILLAREDERHRLLSLVMPELRNLNNASTRKPRITYYPGKDGISKIDNEIIPRYAKSLPSEQRVALEYVNPKDIFSGQFITPDDAQARRLKYGVRLRIIAPRTPFNEKLAAKQKPKDLREIRLVDNLELDSIMYFMIGNRTVMYFLDENHDPGAIIIESGRQTALQRFIFNQLWNQLEPPKS